jgi:hypothetical protein
MTRYLSVPCHRCYAPSRRFRTPEEALQHAQEAARVFHLPMAVWLVVDGRVRLLQQFEATPRRAT